MSDTAVPPQRGRIVASATYRGASRPAASPNDDVMREMSVLRRGQDELRASIWNLSRGIRGDFDRMQASLRAAPEPIVRREVQYVRPEPMPPQEAPAPTQSHAASETTAVKKTQTGEQAMSGGGDHGGGGGGIGQNILMGAVGIVLALGALALFLSFIGYKAPGRSDEYGGLTTGGGGSRASPKLPNPCLKGYYYVPQQHQCKRR